MEALPRGRSGRKAIAFPPLGHLTSASWMYFGVKVEGEYHLWRQRFSRGTAEQITFGPAQQEGLAVAPNGRSLNHFHRHRPKFAMDSRSARGERPVSSEGLVVSIPGWSSSARFSLDGKRLYCLMQRESPYLSRGVLANRCRIGKERTCIAGLFRRRVRRFERRPGSGIFDATPGKTIANLAGYPGPKFASPTHRLRGGVFAVFTVLWSWRQP